MNIANEEIFNNIYNSYSKLAYSIAYEITKNHDISEDITQETFIKVANNLDKLSVASPADIMRTKNFVAIVAKNLTLNMLNYEKRHKKIFFEDMTVEPAYEETFDDNGIFVVLQKMNTTYSHPLLMRFAYGMKDAEIASALGIKNSAVRKRISRAKKILANKLKEGGDL